jgi:hypothetical protein
VRYFKHKGRRERFVIGLERGVAYLCRIRAENAIGWSDWSIASTVITPGMSVSVDTSVGVALRWMEPSLSLNRTVTGYEVLGYKLTGPLTTSHSQLDDQGGANTPQTFVSLCTTITCCATVTAQCPLNNKYVFKVRLQIDNEWLDDSMSLISEIIIL